MDSPFFNSSNEAHQWYKITIPGELDHYYRDSAVIGPDGITLFQFGSASSRLLNFNTRKLPYDLASLIAPGKKIWPFAEIKHDGQAQKPWARLPDYGDMSDHPVANRLQIGFDVEQGNQLRRVYLQSTLSFMGQQNLANNRPPKTYLDAMFIVHSLQHEEVQNAYQWDFRAHRCPVHEIKFDHLQQQLEINTLHEKRIIQRPAFVGNQLIQQQLAEFGASHFGTRMPGAKACDRCLRAKANDSKDMEMIQGHPISICQPTQDPAGKSNCILCWDLHHQECSWTSPGLLDTKGYDKAALHSPQAPGSFTVEGTPFQQFVGAKPTALKPTKTATATGGQSGQRMSGGEQSGNRSSGGGQSGHRSSGGGQGGQRTSGGGQSGHRSSGGNQGGPRVSSRQSSHRDSGGSTRSQGGPYW